MQRSGDAGRWGIAFLPEALGMERRNGEQRDGWVEAEYG